MGQQRRRFSREFKGDAVALVKSSRRPISVVAKELGIGASNLGGWLAKDRAERAVADPAGVRGGGRGVRGEQAVTSSCGGTGG